MVTHWTFSTGIYRTLTLKSWLEAGPDEAALPPDRAVRALREFRAANPGAARPALAECQRAVDGYRSAPDGRRAGLPIDRLVRALETGRLIAVERVAALTPPPLVPKEEATAPPAGPSPARKIWVEIVLLDEEGVPVADEEYALELPDGSVRQGKLDAEGRARVDDIDDGPCRVSFPAIKVRPRPAGAGIRS